MGNVSDGAKGVRQEQGSREGCSTPHSATHPPYSFYTQPMPPLPSPPPPSPAVRTTVTTAIVHRILGLTNSPPPLTTKRISLHSAGALPHITHTSFQVPLCRSITTATTTTTLNGSYAFAVLDLFLVRLEPHCSRGLNAAVSHARQDRAHLHSVQVLRLQPRQGEKDVG